MRRYYSRLTSETKYVIGQEQSNKHDEAPERFTRDVFIMLALAGLGFMVDVYDMALFGVVRVQSLTSFGLTGNEALSAGVVLLNWQMAGMALGGILWGTLGDKRGRRSILLGSIVLYSLANVANSFVNSVETYAAARFLIGIGLAGEVGAAMTIAAEVTPKAKRAYGTAAVAAFSTLGAVLASVIGNLMPWRMAYLTAGAAGFGLLLARFSLKETSYFEKMQHTAVERGSFRMLLSNRGRVLRLIRCVLAAAPLWFALAVIVSFAPEISKDASVTVAACIPFSAIGESVGEFVSGTVSQLLKSRRKTMFAFLAIGSTIIVPIVHSPAKFYAPLCLPSALLFGLLVCSCHHRSRAIRDQFESDCNIAGSQSGARLGDSGYLFVYGGGGSRWSAECSDNRGRRVMPGGGGINLLYGRNSGERSGLYRDITLLFLSSFIREPKGTGK